MMRAKRATFDAETRTRRRVRVAGDMSLAIGTRALLTGSSTWV